MSSRNISFLWALICYLVAAAAGQPSCEGVANLGACRGDIAGFCPKDIECSCNDGHAFCSCPYYKGPNADYWYLGEKCDRLWSTWDLIAVTVFPGVALAFIVAVTAQWIHYCKTSPKNKPRKEQRRASERPTTHAHQNRAFMPEEPSHSSRMADVPLASVSAQPNSQVASRSLPVAQLQNPPRGMNYYSEVPPANPAPIYAEPKPRMPQGYGRGYPEHDYDFDYSQSPRQAPQQEPHQAPQQEPRQSFRFGVPVLPQADYGRGNLEPDSPPAARMDRPFTFGRPQLKSGYGY